MSLCDGQGREEMLWSGKRGINRSTLMRLNVEREKAREGGTCAVRCRGIYMT